MEWLLILVIVLGFATIIYSINKKLGEVYEKQKPTDELLQYLKTTNVRLNEQSKNFNQRLDSATRVIGQVQKNLGEMSEIGRGMKELQDFLKNPKLRGNIGEQVLNELLKQYLPKESFNLQYVFRSGEKVDAAIKTSAGIIPVDSKFPMENFRRINTAEDNGEKKRALKDFETDVKKHIDDISKKYILTEEGTIDYALMYIPSEAVYYEVVNNLSLFEYAGTKRVLPVSPTTFYAYLKAILMSFEGQKIESQAKEILSALRAIQKDYEKVGSGLSVLQKHLTNAHNMMGDILSVFSQLGQKISSTRSLGHGSDKTGKLNE
jgi:DNA recombination protein RmuC